MDLRWSRRAVAPEGVGHRSRERGVSMNVNVTVNVESRKIKKIAIKFSLNLFSTKKKIKTKKLFP
jgi:hypothetical protein